MKICDWKRFLTFAAVVLLFCILCLKQCTKKELELKGTEEYQVQVGDTLWSISNKYRPVKMSIEEYIYNVRKINNEDDCIIQPNDILQMPIFEEV